VRQSQELLEHAKLGHNIQGGGMDRVTAKVAKEVGMLFQDDHVDASAGQQIS